MASDCSFDVVSKVDMDEVKNAVNQATKEIGQRFDFKGSVSKIELKDEAVLVLTSDDEVKLKAVIDVLQGKLVKRNVSIRAMEYGKLEPAAKGTVRQEVKILQGIPSEKAKALVKVLKDAKVKVQAAIQGDQLRVSGKNKDDLQDAIALLKKNDQGLDLQFTNYRS
ncbi:YajQ family cyclic di-GMP-binding protein [Mesoterricola sediminis]|uniref:Nucleotide-binding protein METESE_20010 n=1 Tax=Mesoterricola sediminis TaxID=2927980 RepID=A0AA48HF08_9BACT|nr:YajQ family cyclic di-GMP-binding protein [Mesoterricola sediminis]BDU77043.1 YajQ family cyclic di-GMP-binding protein [Mesoterricola sediminis]